MSFVAPVAQQPSNGLSYAFNQQPVTLVIANVARTGTSPVTYSVEVSTSSTFASTVLAQSGIAEGNNGTTSVVLPQLSGNATTNTTYFWRWRAAVDGITGEPSAPLSFVVRPNIVIGVATFREPAIGAELFTARPVFTINNAVNTGPAGPITYEFQVSTSAAFSTLVAGASVLQQTPTTSWTPTVDLPVASLFWRVRARDLTNGFDGAFSNTWTFQRKAGIDINTAVIAFGPPSIKTWPVTAKLTDVYFVPGEDDVLCTVYDQPGWPETAFTLAPPEEKAVVAANQWVFVNIGGTWYGGVSAWMRSTSQFCKKDYDQNFFIDSLGHSYPFGPAYNTVLHGGDVIGVMMSTPARAWPEMSTRDERSNIVLVAWPQGR